MKTTKNIFIAATGQNVGKTTNCLGLYHKLVKSGLDTGFIKPVGQRYLNIKDFKVDEDSYLIHQIYNVDCELRHMNPVAVPIGFTQKYIEKPKKDWLLDQVRDSYDIVQKDRDFVLIEGTGHAGVGSVFDASNAIVAKALQSKVVIVTDGGIGKAIDSLILNKCLFDSMGVELLGVIVNKVYLDKYEKIKHFVSKSLAAKKIRLLGVVPYKDRLKNPNMGQIQQVLGGEFLTGKEYKTNHVEKIIVGAMSVSNVLKNIKKDTLIITPGDREDVILAALSWNLAETSRVNYISGLVITADLKPGRAVSRVMNNSDIPIIMTKYDTFTTASMVHDLNVKIKVSDTEKIKLSQKLFDQYVDFDYLIENC